MAGGSSEVHHDVEFIGLECAFNKLVSAPLVHLVFTQGVH